MLSCGYSSSSTAEEKIQPKTVDELKLQLREVMDLYDIPGLSIAVVTDKNDLFVAGMGYADLESQRKASAETLFRIGSISKMFVGLAALKLVEEGKLKLNTPLRDLAPEIEFDNPWEKNDPVRFVHLLEHTTGWDDLHLPEFASNDPKPLSLEEGIMLHPDSRQSRWRPGTKVAYSNSGAAVAAYVIQKITNTDFEKYVKHEFFNNLDMMTATFRKPESEVLTASLYSYGTKQPYWHVSMRPSGAINASARDMSGFVKFLINRGSFNGEQLLKPQSIYRMEHPESSLAARSGLVNGYGLANFSTPYKNFIIYGHNGGVNGGLSNLGYLPNEKVGYVLMINSDSSEGLEELTQRVRRFITYGRSGPKLPKVKSVNDSVINDYSGYYVATNPRSESDYFAEYFLGQVNISFEKDKVSFSNRENEVYVPVGNNRFRLDNESAATMILLRDQDGVAIEKNGTYYSKISAFEYYSALFFSNAMILLIILNVLWAFIWSVRRFSKKIERGAAMQVRVWPFLSSFIVSLIFILVLMGSEDLSALATVSIYSIGIMVLTYLYFFTSLIGLLQNIRYITAKVNPITKIFGFISSIVFFVMAIYLANFGVIGLQTYA